MRLVLKIGGSIFENPTIFNHFFNVFLETLDSDTSYLIIVGGGEECNTLRQEYLSQSKVRKEEEYYHWKAIEIMDKNAEKLKRRVESLCKTYLISNVEEIINPGIFFLKPSHDLRNHDPLEHSWNVTSDSISLFYAYKTRSSLCVFIKKDPYLTIDEVPIKRISCTKLIKHQIKQKVAENLGKGLIDTVSPHLGMKYQIPILILNGSNPLIIANFFSKYQKEEKNLSNYGIEIYPQ